MEYTGLGVSWKLYIIRFRLAGLTTKYMELIRMSFVPLVLISSIFTSCFCLFYWKLHVYNQLTAIMATMMIRINIYHINMGIILPTYVQVSIQTLIEMQNANHETCRTPCHEKTIDIKRTSMRQEDSKQATRMSSEAQANQEPEATNPSKTHTPSLLPASPAPGQSQTSKPSPRIAKPE